MTGTPILQMAAILAFLPLMEASIVLRTRTQDSRNATNVEIHL